jgi:putative peptide zinc metalloprotease protein
MAEENKKVVLPPYLLRRLEAFRIVKGGETTYIVRDKVANRSFDFDAWQFYILEALASYDTFDKLGLAFIERFGREITRDELDRFLAQVADQKMFSEAAEQHPLLLPFTRRTFDVKDGQATLKSFEASVIASAGTGATAVATGSDDRLPAYGDLVRAATAGTASAGSSTAASASLAAAGAPAPPAAAVHFVATPAGAGAASTASTAADSRSAAKPRGAQTPGEPQQPEQLPAGVQDALGLDWRTTKSFIGLFNPRWLLDTLMPVLRPLRHLRYAVPVLVVAALFIVFTYPHVVVDDLRKFKLDHSLIEHLILVFLTVHVVNTFTAAAVAHHFKVSVDKVGVAFVFGFMPRWALKMTGAEFMSRRQAMWLHGSTLLSRLFMFAGGMLAWYATRDANAWWSQLGLVLSIACGVGLLLEAGNPLVKANGYYLTAAFLNEPHLRGKAFAALANKVTGRVYKAADSNVLALYGLLSLTYVFALILFMGWVLARFLTGDAGLGGAGIAIVVAFAGFMIWRNVAGLQKFAHTYERQLQFDRWRSRTLPVEAAEADSPATRTSYWKRALALGAVLLLFLPYTYEPSGNFVVFPVRRAAITTDTPGVIAEVFFDGGETVKQGTVLARLAGDDYQAQIKTLDAQIAEQEYVIANLLALPKPEEVKVAEEQLRLAKARVPFTRDKVQRLEKLQPEGAVTLEEVEHARKEFDNDKMQVLEKEAALRLAKTGPTKDHIASERAKLVSLKEQRAGVAQKLDRTVLRMPFDGNILSLHLKDRTNSFLPQGTSFAEVENTGTVTAQIDVTESDIQHVKVGAPVRARPSAWFNDEFEGKVTLIDRNVTAKSFGNVIRVIATFDNKDGRLITGMAGQAKVEATTMPVWKAFTQAIWRFVRVHLWAWIP